MENKKTLKKPLTKKATPPPNAPVEPIEPDWGRPFTVKYEIYFAEGGRKVYPKHLREAMIAGEAAIRARLESREPSYEIAEIEPEAKYDYLQWHSDWPEA